MDPEVEDGLLEPVSPPPVLSPVDDINSDYEENVEDEDLEDPPGCLFTCIHIILLITNL